MKYRILLILLVFLGGALVGCDPIVQAAQPAQTDQAILDAVNPVGQTFVARYAGLNAIQFVLSPSQAGEGEVALSLYAEPGSEQVLARAVMPLNQAAQAASYRFDFPALGDSNQKYYYAELSVTGTGSLSVSTAAGNTYLDGALYQGRTPMDGQLCFSLEYEAGPLLMGLGGELIHWAGVLGLSALLYILPGWGVLGWLWKGWQRLLWGEKLGLAAGFSLAQYAVVMMLTDQIGLHLGAGYAWGMILFGTIGVLTKWLWKCDPLLKIRDLYLDIKDSIKNLGSKLPDIALLILIGILFTTRWWAIREIEAPMWGDSVQHAVIAQLIVDNDGLFKDWSPYTPYGSLTVQHVFSEAVALFTWLSGVEAWKATLWVGQILNGLSILAIYPLVVKVCSGNRWCGWGAILVAGLVTLLPTFYVNWGRYAQMTGQVILPIATYMTWVLLEPNPSEFDNPKPARNRFRGIILRIDGWQLAVTGLTLTGMILAYYRMAHIYTVFVLALVFVWGIPRWGRKLCEWLLAMGKLTTLGLFAGLLFLPWLLQISTGMLVDTIQASATGSTFFHGLVIDYRGIYATTYSYYPKWLIIITGICVLWSILRRQWQVGMVGLWTLGLVLLPAGGLIGIPGTKMIASFAILILLYIPISILTGWIIGLIIEWIWRVLGGRGNFFVFGILTGLCLWFAWGQRAISLPEQYAMVTRPDLLAMSWIRENTPDDASFLVEGFRVFSGTSAVGADAGWWIPLYTERQNTMPPQYAIVNEVPLETGYSQQVVDIVAALEDSSLDTVDGLKILCNYGINFIYIGQLQVVVGYGVTQLYSTEELLFQPSVELVYHRDRVYIFELQPEGCEGTQQ